MDFANERYVRLYVRDTLTWERLGFYGQSLFCLLLRKVDRSGVLDIEDMRPAEALAAVLKGPVEFCGRGWESLSKAKVAVHRGTCIVIPRFLDAQEARRSDVQRQRDSRERRRAESLREQHASRSRVDEIRAGRFGDDVRGTIYVVSTQDGGLYKIGFTQAAVLDRVWQLERARGEKLSLVGFIDGSKGEERALHEEFGDHRVEGEWFEPSPELLVWASKLAVPVTAGHTLSHAVTPAVPCRTVLATPAKEERTTVPSSSVPSRPAPNGTVGVQNQSRPTGRPVEESTVRLTEAQKAAVTLLVRDIVKATGDDQPRSVGYFTRVATVLGEQKVRQLLSETRDEANRGTLKNPAAYFTRLASNAMEKR